MAAQLGLYDWQLEAMQALQDPDIEQIGTGGARGPGKSHLLRVAYVSRALEMPGTDHILFRRTSDDIVKQYAPRFKELLEDYGGCKIPYAYNSQYKTFTVGCPNGGNSRIILAFAEYVKHAEKHQGPEYATIGFDEATHFEERIYDLIGGSARGNRRVKKLISCNPGGIGHRWVKKRFVKSASRDAKTVWIPALLKDNIYLRDNDPNYADRLTRGLPDWIKRQWLDGDWDVSEGSYFAVPSGCVRFVQPPPWARWYAGVDWGYFPSAFACVWVACWIEPITGRHRVHVFADLKAHKLNDPQQAQLALEMEERWQQNLRHSIRIQARFADPSTGKQNPSDSDEQTRTTRRTWARHGFVTIPAKRRGRVPGWMLLRDFLAPLQGYSPDPDEPHGVLTISPNCMQLITELQDAIYEQSQGTISGDDLEGEDHCLDCLRYLLSMVYNATFPVQELDPYEMKLISA